MAPGATKAAPLLNLASTTENGKETSLTISSVILSLSSHALAAATETAPTPAPATAPVPLKPVPTTSPTTFLVVIGA